MRNKFISLLEAESVNDPSIKILTGDLGYGVLDNYSKNYPDRFVNCGIAEQSMIGIAGGLSSMGHKVFVYSIANFPTFRCLEQIRNDLIYMRNNVVIVSVGAGFAYGAQGYTHHGIEDISIMRCMEGIKVFTPADDVELEIVFHQLMKTEETCYLRLGKGGELPIGSEEIDGINSFRLINSTEFDSQLPKVCILSCGPISYNLIEVVNMLEKKINLTCYSFLSLDKIELIKYFKNSEYQYIITLEEHVIAGGFGSFVNESLNRYAKDFQLVNIGITNGSAKVFGNQEYLRKSHKLDPESILETILEIVKC